MADDASGLRAGFADVCGTVVMLMVLSASVSHCSLSPSGMPSVLNGLFGLVFVAVVVVFPSFSHSAD